MVNNWLVAPMFCIALFSGISAYAQGTLVDADAIEQALQAPAASAAVFKGISRGYRMTKPEPDTRLCDREQSAHLQAEPGVTAGGLVKSLYVDEAPRIDLDVLFDFNKASLSVEGSAQLDRLAQALARPSLARYRFVLAGHTDRKGDADYNDALSCERALAARAYLRDRHQIEARRVIPMGFGFARPKDPGDPNSAVNRRVEVRRYDGLGPRP